MQLDESGPGDGERWRLALLERLTKADLKSLGANSSAVLVCAFGTGVGLPRWSLWGAGGLLGLRLLPVALDCIDQSLYSAERVWAHLASWRRSPGDASEPADLPSRPT